MTSPRIATCPTVRPVFQVAVGDAEVETGQARYDVARYDTWPDTYSGLDAQWTDDACEVIEANTWCGRESTIDAFDVGTASVTVKNPDGMWDYPPVEQSTPLVIRPGRQARLGVIVDGAEAPVILWRGWIDSMTPTYLPSGDDVVQIECVDAKGEVGRTEAPRTTAPVGAGETVTARMGRLANLAAFPAHRRQFDPSGVALVGSQLGGRVGLLLDDAAKSAGGDVHGDTAGVLRYRARDWQTHQPDRPLDGAIGNRGVPGEVCPTRWEISFARSDFATRVNYARAGEDAATIDDLPNRVRYGVETFDMTNMETADDDELANLAARALRVRNFDRAPRIAACHLDAARAGVVPLLLEASPFRPSVYACGLVQHGRAVFARTLYLTGIEHTITGAAWTARLALDDTQPWQIPTDTRYDSARYDVDRYSPLA